LISGGLLKAFGIGEPTKSSGGGGVPQKTEYGVCNAVAFKEILTEVRNFS
jgi:hypothetical protein